jgi:hypothetical protein
LIGLVTSIRSLTLQLLAVNMEIAKLKHIRYEASKVFVVFNTEQSQRQCLEALSVGTIPV